MAERQPISGRIIEVVQRKYIAVRVTTGSATECSGSELFLKPLKERGIIHGLPIAINSFHEAILETGSWDKACHGWLETGISLFISGPAFIAIAAGITGLGLEKGGNWKGWPVGKPKE